MPCGCTNNKNLNKDKLSLESMQTLSIDEIINLYRQGYTLEENDLNETSIYSDIYSQTDIQSLTLSNPDLKDATGYYVSATGRSYALWIWTNPGGYGYANFEFYRPETTTIISRTTCCYPAKTGPLKYLHVVDITHPAPILNNYDMKAFRCSSDTQQTCPSGSDPNCYGTCSSGANLLTDMLLGMSIRAYNGTILPAPTTLTITPGDGNLNLQWTSVTDAFAYYIEIKRVAVLINSGYVTSSENTGQITISGLTNGLLYDISVKAVSHSNIMGAAKTGSGTPGVTCQSITLTQPSPSTVTKGALVRLTANTTPTTQQFTIEFRDQDNILLGIGCLTSGGACFIDWDTSTITATLPKTYNITAKVPGTPCVSGIVNVIVNPIAITCQSISNVNADPSTLTLGGTVTLTATVTPSATTIQEFDVDFKDVTTTLNTAPITTVNHIATFDWIPATSKTYSIKAYSGTCVSPTATPVTVDPVPTCTSLSLTSPSTGVRGGSITLSATMSPVTSGVGVVFKDGTITLATSSTDGTGKATYIWSIPTNATLGDHTISASVPGTNCTDSKVVSISSQILTTITISPPSQSIGVGSTIQLTAICKDLNTTTMVCPTLTWVSSNTGKVTVNSSGLVTGIAEGTANVTASAGTVTSNASVITVTTAPPPQAGGGGAMVMVVVALVAAAMFMMRKPRTLPT